VLSRRHQAGAASVDTQEGSIVLAVLVLMLVVTLSALAFARAGHSLSLGADDSNLSRAGAVAELGVNEAFARIDAGETSPFTGAGFVGGVSYDYAAQPSGRSTWTVRSEATAGSIGRALRAIVGRNALYPFTLFADTELVIDRNTALISGRVGTNGTMTVVGPSPGDVQELYRPDGSCTGCGDPVAVDGPRRLDPVGLPAGPVISCPEGGSFEGAFDGQSGAVIVCDDPATPVAFVGEVTVINPPLVVYVGRDVTLSLDGASVNRAGRAADLQLHVAGEPADAVASITASAAEVTGLLYAPGRALVTTDTAVTGSLTLGRLEVGRGGRLAIDEDETIGPLGDGEWRILELRTVGLST
jgi:hypothetical protein